MTPFKTSAVPRPAVGKKAPLIDLPAVDGSDWRLVDQRGRTVVLIFHRHIH